MVASQKVIRENKVRTNALVSSDDIQFYFDKKEILKKCESIPVRLSAEEWQFMAENQIEEAAKSIVESTSHYYHPDFYNAGSDIKNQRIYLANLSPEVISPLLYGWLYKAGNGTETILSLIKECKLLDFDLLYSLFDDENLADRKLALQIAVCDKLSYDKNDIANFQKLIEKIKSAFPEIVKYIEEKSLLSSTVTRKWICGCKRKNPENEDKCLDCERDRWGFFSNELTPAKVIETLETEVEYLISVFLKETDK